MIQWKQTQYWTVCCIASQKMKWQVNADLQLNLKTGKRAASNHEVAERLTVLNQLSKSRLIRLVYTIDSWNPRQITSGQKVYSHNAQQFTVRGNHPRGRH